MERLTACTVCGRYKREKYPVGKCMQCAGYRSRNLSCTLCKDTGKIKVLATGKMMKCPRTPHPESKQGNTQ